MRRRSTPDRPMGRKPKYPWEEWLMSGENRNLRRGQDFDEDAVIENLRTYILARARAAGIEILTSIVDNDTLSIMFPIRRVNSVELLSHDDWSKILFPRQYGHAAATLSAARLGKVPISVWIDAIERKAPSTLAYRLIYDRFAHELTIEPLVGDEYMDFDVEERR